ncbi:Cytochrome c-551 [Sulfitobacter noctilucae]|uniref:c-type cytochrome n=1 Tax=Sulfitobacter noctilucae TaxID=1342302 RepID=UPI000469029D|nr:cytochrome c [Sulfitobacter noctilucae]KIN70302.1 Cytochrome c-551 [Sulfitobacter noctilucae]
MKILRTAAVGFALMAGSAFADGHATGDAAEGEGVFSKCKACHGIVSADGDVIVKGGRTGPNLYGLHTRVAGGDEDFGRKYGDALVEAGENGLEWNEANFVSYVADPRAFLREYNDDKRARSKMSFKLGDETDAKNVWAYIVSVGPEVEAEDVTN